MNARTLLLSLLLLLLAGSLRTAAQGQSPLQVQPIINRQLGHQVNLRVEVRNISGQTVRMPFQVRLMARSNRADAWSVVKAWNLTKVPPGQIVARDFLPVPPLDPALAGGHPWLRAEVWSGSQLLSSTEQTVGHGEPNY